MQCSSCRFDNERTAKFCAECGVRLNQGCPSCAAPVSPGQKFCAECGTRLTAQTMPAAVPEAERRQLTVMFCDLVDSTALSQTLDPEALREIMRAYQQTCARVIERYEGHVAQYLGDGLMTYFGWPKAHEDDAERAVLAGIEIVDAIKTIGGVAPLRVRIGIATGPVVVGETGDGDASVPKIAVGETPNLAARLQGLAGADEIIVSAATRRLLGAAFEYADLGARKLKGITEPVHALRVLRVAPADSRFEASHEANLISLVGRESELALLFDRWEQARAGEGQVVLLSGEPGIGKSRIAQALRERIGQEQHMRLRYQCSPYHTGSALHPIIVQLERAACFERDETTDAKLDKLEAMLAVEPGQLPVVAPLIASLLGLPIDRYPSRMLSAQKQKELTMDALVDQMLSLSVRQPVLVIFEDAHWTDPTTLEALGLIVERSRDAAILLIVTHRPEFSAPWVGRSHVTTFNLNRLSRRHGTTMIGRLTGGKQLPEEILNQILARTDGIPLFVEELTRTVLEAGFLKEEGERYTIDGPLPSLAIPSTLRDSLMARLDRLNRVKEIAQIGACIGREFSQELLAAVSSLSEEGLEAALCQLVDSGIMFRRGHAPETECIFKHALVQDTAYESLLNSRRQEIHGQIARTLESRFPETVKANPELLALHYTKAGMFADALPRWIAATQFAAVGTRYLEALSHAENGFAIMDRVSTGIRVDLEVALCVTAGFCHISLAGYASEPAADLFTRAEALLDRVTDYDVSASALWGVGVHAWTRGDFAKALPTYERLGALAALTGEVDKRIFANFCLGSLLMHVCELDRSQLLLEFIVDNYDPSKHSRFVYAVGQDVKVTGCAWLASVCLWRGQVDKARKFGRLAIEHSTALAHAFSMSLALSMAAFPFAETGNPEEALHMARKCIDLCESQRIPFWMGWAMVMEGVALQEQGQHALAAERLGQAIEHLRSTGSRGGEGYIRSWRAIALAHAGRFEEARQEAEEGRNGGMRTGETIFIAANLHALGVVALLDDNASRESAERWFIEAVDEAKSRGNRLIELRAANALARLWQKRGATHEARELLAPIYEWFTEGLDGKDLTEARAIIDELRG